VKIVAVTGGAQGIGRPEDIADACFHLVEQAGFMSGQNLTLDGGMTVGMIYEA